MVTKQKILIVDDDENIAELISLYLLKECFDTVSYTHLDVYKRQILISSQLFLPSTPLQ